VATVENQCGDVVLVDDNLPFRSFLTGVLEQAGYATVAVPNAEEALASVQDCKAGVVLTDVELPGVSGYELCRQLKDEHGDSVAVMIISGTRTEPFDRAAGIMLGADDYMIKPVDPGELVARVRRLAARSNGLRGTAPQESTNGKLDVLSSRERQVLDLLAGGSDQEEIARTLFISPKTVATHIQRILTKLDVHSRAEAVAYAHRNRLFEPL
jgi:DNA-binding NarL/FixJ family response regulator